MNLDDVLFFVLIGLPIIVVLFALAVTGSGLLLRMCWETWKNEILRHREEG